MESDCALQVDIDTDIDIDEPNAVGKLAEVRFQLCGVCKVDARCRIAKLYLVEELILLSLAKVVFFNQISRQSTCSYHLAKLVVAANL